jgi:hypothetical protein
MNITVIIPSRKRVRGLSAVLTSLHNLESGKHNVQYIVGCDEDDKATINLCAMIQRDMPNKFSYKVGPRPKTLGGLVNHLAELVPGEVYTALCDDLICTTPHWDKLIAEAVMLKPYGVFWWKNAFEFLVTYAIVTERWRQAAGGIFCGHFPYWFEDLWLFEQWTMATDEEALGVNCCIAEKMTGTIRMRELSFWCDFFNKTRTHRVTQSKEIAARLGLSEPKKSGEFAEIMAKGIAARMTPELIEQIERQGDASSPEESYLAAKADAIKMLEAIAA